MAFDLIDDVLREIFRNLNARDLCSVADVCSAFKRNAQTEFALRYKDLNFIPFRRDKDSYDITTKTFHLRQMAPVLRNFGQSLNAIHIMAPMTTQHSHRMMEIIDQHHGASLRDLSLVIFEFSADLVQKLRPFLSRLQRLVLSCCSWTSKSVALEMFSFCGELETLVISGSIYEFDACVALPKLKTLTFFGTDVSNETIENFLAARPPLNEIIMDGCSGITSEIIPILAECAPEIKKIVLKNISGLGNGFVENAKQLNRLTALKTLRIDCGGVTATPILKELASDVECLELDNFRSDSEFATELSGLKQLKKLSLFPRENLEVSDISMILSCLNELTELHLYNGSIVDLVEIVRSAPKLLKLGYESRIASSMDADLFMQIRNVVAERKQPCPLVLAWLYDLDENQLNVPEGILKINCSDDYDDDDDDDGDDDDDDEDDSLVFDWKCNWE